MKSKDEIQARIETLQAAKSHSKRKQLLEKQINVLEWVIDEDVEQSGKTKLEA